MKKTLLRGGTIAGLDEKADVLIGVDGVIERLGKDISHKEAQIVEAEGLLLFPRLIDCHVHFREPGLTQKATMASEAAAARAGGVGLVCEMPNTIPPTVTVAALADKVRRSSTIDDCELRFFFGVTEAIHLQALVDLWTGESLELKRLKRHCCGVKLYLDHSTGDQKVDGGIVEDIFRRCALHGIPLVAHCEDAAMNAAAKAAIEEAHASSEKVPSDVALHSAMRPAASEAAAIAFALGLAKRHGTRFHVAHLSTAEGLELIRTAKEERVNVTCEVAPHHLFLTTDDYATLGARGKMNPPLRSYSDRDALWQGLLDGTIDCIATDHAPHTTAEKSIENPLTAPSGVPGVETMLPLLLSVAAGHWPHPESRRPASSGQFSYADILRCCFTSPKAIFSLDAPAIEKGARAQIVIVDPLAKSSISAETLQSHCDWTPFEGWSITGGIVREVPAAAPR